MGRNELREITLRWRPLKSERRLLLSLLFRCRRVFIARPSWSMQEVGEPRNCLSISWLIELARLHTTHLHFFERAVVSVGQMVPPPSRRWPGTAAASAAAPRWRWSRRLSTTAPATRAWRVTRRCEPPTASGDASTPASASPYSVSLSTSPVVSLWVCPLYQSSVCESVRFTSRQSVSLSASPVVSLWVCPLHQSSVCESVSTSRQPVSLSAPPVVSLWVCLHQSSASESVRSTSRQSVRLSPHASPVVSLWVCPLHQSPICESLWGVSYARWRCQTSALLICVRSPRERRPPADRTIWEWILLRDQLRQWCAHSLIGFTVQSSRALLSKRWFPAYA